jgi:hypothetical protein
MTGDSNEWIGIIVARLASVKDMVRPGVIIRNNETNQAGK